jgi:ethanolamine utilization cobalamin adenosyltransferase
LDEPSRKSPEAVPFVCEDDVRQALKAGRTIAIDGRTIVTPSARDLAQHCTVLVEVGDGK